MLMMYLQMYTIFANTGKRMIFIHQISRQNILPCNEALILLDGCIFDHAQLKQYIYGCFLIR